jgi:hypothetical protein
MKCACEDYSRRSTYRGCHFRESSRDISDGHDLGAVNAALSTNYKGVYEAVVVWVGRRGDPEGHWGLIVCGGGSAWLTPPRAYQDMVFPARAKTRVRVTELIGRNPTSWPW